ncbi:MAG: hypothetical protein V1744_06930 [Candidatus Altiarchaeota archaeon]
MSKEKHDDIEITLGPRRYLGPAFIPPRQAGDRNNPICNVGGLEVYDAWEMLSSCRDNRDRAAYVKRNWSAHKSITEVSLGTVDRHISQDTAKDIVESYKKSRRVNREVSLIYSRESQNQERDDIVLHREIIPRGDEYKTGSHGDVVVASPLDLEWGQLDRAKPGQRYGAGHIHPPGYGPAPSHVGDLDVNMMLLYTEVGRDGESKGGRMRLHDKSLREHLTNEHLYIAPYPGDPDKMLIGLCSLEEGGKLTYHPVVVD